MTIEGYRLSAAAWRFPAVIAGISGRVRLALRRRQALMELNGLSDHHLKDIGIDRPQIPELVNREIAWNDLLDSGWPRSRQPRRR